MARAVRGTSTPVSKLRPGRAVATFNRFQSARVKLDSTLREHGIKPSDTAAVNYQRKLRRLEANVNSDSPPPDLATSLSRTLLALNLGLIGTAEATYSENSTDRNLYALIALVELCRGLSNDLKSQNDLNGLLERILAEVLDPALATIAAQIAAQYSALRRTAADSGGKMALQLAGELERSGRELAGLLGETREQVGVRLRAQLTGGK